MDGPYFTAIYPLWCCVMAVVTSMQAEHVEMLYEQLRNISQRNKGVSQTLPAVAWTTTN